MDPILEIAARYGLIIVEDACQAHGAEYRGQRAGSFGTGAFSLYATKNMTCAEGGMITTDDGAVADRCCVIRQHGCRRRYYHDQLGFNYRMTDVHAAIGLAQIRKLERFNNARIANAGYLTAHLEGVRTPRVPIGHRHVFHQYTIRLETGGRDNLAEHLRTNGVGSSVYYPVPIHQQTCYADEPGCNVALPEAERAAGEVLSLPVHPALSQADLEAIVLAVNSFRREPAVVDTVSAAVVEGA